MPISRRYLITSTLLFLLVGAAALLALVGATVWLSQKAQVDAGLVNEQRVVRNRAVSVREALLTAESSQRGYLITGNEIYLAPYDNAKLVAQAELAELVAAVRRVARFQPMLPRLGTLVEQRLAELDEGIRLRDAGALNGGGAPAGTNQGKALMDELQVFLSAIVLEADDAQTVNLSTQTANILALRIGTVLVSILILGVVAGVVVTFARYTREIVEARDALAKANAGLEARVAERTKDLVQARDRAEILLTEVNHRVANNLALIGALIHMQRQAVVDEAARAALDETNARIQAITEIHKHLYTAGDVTSVELDGYMGALLAQLEKTLASEGHGAWIRQDIEPVRVSTNASINLGIIVVEWVTNAFKYAYKGRAGEVRVLARRSDSNLLVAVQDDGTGIAPGQPARGSGVGSRIVTTIARSLEARVEYLNLNPGTDARILLPLEPA